MKRYDLILVVGNRGHGKTTWTAQYLKREIESKKLYTRGLANIHYYDSPEIEFTNYAGIRCLDDPSESGQPKILVHIDQIHKYFDGRESHTRASLDFWDTLVESRQHGFDIVGTTWAYSSIDPRLRKFANLIVECHREWDGFHYDYFDNDAKHFISPNGGFVIDFRQAKKWWRYFRTGELVKDTSLQEIAALPKPDRGALAKRLAFYEPCGEPFIAAT